MTDADNLVVIKDDSDYEHILNKLINKNVIIFLDEDVRLVKDNDFVRYVDNLGFYLVIISRDNLKYFDYAVDEVYEIHGEKRGKVTYNRLKRRYKGIEFRDTPDLLITEDSNFGYYVMKKLINCDVESACGKDKIKDIIIDKLSTYNKVCILADGAAFGKNIEEILILQTINRSKNIYLLLPESFEWIVLNTTPFINLVRDELNSTFDYADTLKYKSWENYFYELLKEKACKYNVTYSKNRIGGFYKIYGKDINSMLSEIRGVLSNMSNSYSKRRHI